jgi:hypothetical protein
LLEQLNPAAADHGKATGHVGRCDRLRPQPAAGKRKEGIKNQRDCFYRGAQRRTIHRTTQLVRREVWSA